jgi:3-oxoacyl-[acyl-carrier-protein] synthase-3
MTTRAVITGVGAYLPENILTNADLERIVDTNDEWIRTRTGITARHIVAEGEMTSDLATKAAQAALLHAGVEAKDIDLVLVATSTPDFTMPSTATLVQNKLKIAGGFAFDLAAACSGFIYGLQVAEGLLLTGKAKRALVIGAETMSRIVDWKDRGTCVLFGDGAGAVVLEAQKGERGILGGRLYSDGQYGEILKTDGGISHNQSAGQLRMAGQEVFRHGVEKMAEATLSLIHQCGLTAESIDWFIPHQANARIIQSIGRKLEVAPEKFLITLDKHANTSAASIPLALNDGIQSGRVRQGEILALPALGAGLTWGCCIIRL